MTRSREAGLGSAKTTLTTRSGPALSKGGGRRPTKDGRVYITLRIDPDIVKRIDAECQERLVSRTKLIESVMEDWLDLNEGDA